MSAHTTETGGDGRRVLAIGAHPDDIEFGAGGTIARWVDEGWDVRYLIVTSGQRGVQDANQDPEEFGRLREEESRAAAKVAGVTDVTFLGYPDGRLEATIALRRDISRVIRRVRPQRVVSQSPERSFRRIYASHPDHLAAGEATMAAVYPDARNPFAHPELLEEGFEPWSVPEMYLATADESDVFVEITNTFERKLEALRCHASQMTDLDGLDARIRAWNNENARDGGLPDGALAETYLHVDTR
jgi:LmbE family N-acetylglucosaminyl deacetylase